MHSTARISLGCTAALLLVSGTALANNAIDESAAGVPPAQAVDPRPDVPAAPDTPPEPAPASTGIRGTVTDVESEYGMPGVDITTSGLEAKTITTDLEGGFVLELTPGKYEITVSTVGYDVIKRVVVVRAGKLAKLDVTLSPMLSGTETIEVVSKVDPKSESAALARRQAASTVTDSLSGQEIKRSPDSSAGDAVKRVVSVTVTDGKYVALRGLEGRYVTTLLNGVVLPSPEPDRNAVPLDLFPTALLSSLTVVKSYGAELPAQFGGGALLIDTNSYPTQRELKFSVATAASSATQLQDGIGNSAGGGGDFFGWGSSGRSLPGAVPRGQAVRNLSAEQTETIGEAFDNTWSANDAAPPPNFNVGVSLGDTTRVGGKNLGYLVAGGFRRNLSTQRGVARSVGVDAGQLTVQDDLRYMTGEAEATVNALGNVAYELADNHRVQLFALYTHVGEDGTGKVDGYSDRDSAGLASTRLAFVERALTFAQVTGTHDFPNARGMQLTWQGNAAVTTRDELDTRDVTYNVAPNGVATFRDQPGSGQRFFSLLDETAVGGGSDLRIPLNEVLIRAGAAVRDQRRSLQSRRFRYEFIGESNSVRQLAPEQMFSAEHIGPDFRLTEATLQEDSYQADLQVAAAYVSGELQATDKLRIIAGLRAERATQSVSNGTSFAVSGMTYDLDRLDVDVLPTVNVVYVARSNMNFRAAYSSTLVRPRFRELAPFLFFDYSRRRSVSGNPNLETTHLTSGDLRWEMFPGESEVVAASVFGKQFRSPIEQVVTNVSSGDASFRNAERGNVLGLEVEARIGLGRLHRGLRNLRLAGNVALMQSSVDLGADAVLLTSQNRPMYGQSPYAVNLTLEYRRPSFADIGLLYNVVGKRISDVGTQGLPDAYEQPQHRVDVVITRAIRHDLTARAAVTNLFNQDTRITQDDLVVSSREVGVGVSVGLEWTP